MLGRNWIFIKKTPMCDANIYRTALAAVTSGDYCESDVKVLKEQLNDFNKRESTIRRQMERDTNEFVKNKGKNQTELKNIRTYIKELKNILKAV